MRKKITVVGAGNVGAQAAFFAAMRSFGDIVLVDVIEGLAKGKALDILQASPICGYDCNIVGTSDYRETGDSDVSIITAGIPRKPGMTREELLSTNASIVKSVTEQIAKYSPESVIIVVTNPLDAMAYVAFKVSKFPRNRVIGMAGVLDTSRLKTFIASELKVSAMEIDAMVLGGHGDDMVPLIRHATVSGRPLPQLLPIEKIVEHTKKGGEEIINLLKTGSAFFAPAASAVSMAEAIIQDKKSIMPCSAYLEGEYGFKGCFLGVPVKLGKEGIEEIVEVELNAEERELLKKTYERVKGLTELVERYLK